MVYINIVDVYYYAMNSNTIINVNTTSDSVGVLVVYNDTRNEYSTKIHTTYSV